MVCFKTRTRSQIRRFRHVTQIYNPPIPPQNMFQGDNEEEEKGELKAFEGEVIGILEIED